MTWAGNRRRTRRCEFEVPVVLDADVPLAVRKLYPGGMAGRYTAASIQTKDEQVRDSNSWNLNRSTCHEASRLPPLPSIATNVPTPLCLPTNDNIAANPTPQDSVPLDIPPPLCLPTNNNIAATTPQDSVTLDIPPPLCLPTNNNIAATTSQDSGPLDIPPPL